MKIRPRIRAYPLLTGFAFAVTVFFALLPPHAAYAQVADPGDQGGSKLKVMTYNVYAGTSYAGATDPNLAVFLQSMTNALLEIRASDPAGRAQAVAREIAAHSPHLVSLQEVFTVSTGPTKDSLTLEFDYLQLLLQALADMGANYTPVESVQTWDATVPTTVGYLRSSWRIVILARTDLKAEHFFVTNVDGNRFSSRITYPLPALNGSADCPSDLVGSACYMAWPRGWAFADITYRGKQFRFVNATLESNSTSRNIAQGVELLNGPLQTDRSVALAADLNCDLSNATDPKLATCVRILNAGFEDAWGAAKPAGPGFTKELPIMTMRGDYVMLRGWLHAESAALVGDDAADMTASGLWPSNHAGVIAKLERAE